MVEDDCAMTSEPPRPLTSAERAMLGLILAQDFVGANQLRAQADVAVVVGRCDCGCPTFDLAVPAGLPAAPLEDGLVPCEAEVAPVGDEAPGQVILFVKEGRLRGLEYVWFGGVDDQPPQAWPEPSRVHVFRTDVGAE